MSEQKLTKFMAVNEAGEEIATLTIPAEGVRVEESNLVEEWTAVSGEHQGRGVRLHINPEKVAAVLELTGEPEEAG